MPVPSNVVIVGSSIAGVRTAQSLRTEGYAGHLVLVGEENDLPYDKPPLSKQFLGGDADDADVGLLTRAEAEELHLELRLGVPATRLDLAAGKLFLADGVALDWDTVVLATGASARPSPWTAESGVHVLRTLTDARKLRAQLRPGQPVVIVGGGFIGAEVAATARARGCDVTVVDPLSAPIGRVVGHQLGAVFNELHRRHGVTTEFGNGVESISGREGDLKVTLTDGRTLSTGTVLVGIGAVPNDGWLADSGLQVGNGVACDEYCRAVNTTNVYVVGDLARHFCTPERHYVRVEHWSNAVDSAVAAAHNIAHPDHPRAHAVVEYIWSDQYDWKIQIAGRPAAATDHELIGDFVGANARGAALYCDGAGLLRGAVTVNWPKALVMCRQLIRSGASFAGARDQLQRLVAG